MLQREFQKRIKACAQVHISGYTPDVRFFVLLILLNALGSVHFETDGRMLRYITGVRKMSEAYCSRLGD